MSFDYRFQPPTLADLEDPTDYECDKDCENCTFDCEGADEDE